MIIHSDRNGSNFFFWAVKATIKDHHIEDYCLWRRGLFSYPGLRSHNPLLETPGSNFDLSNEQLEAMAATRKAKDRAYNIEHYEHSHATDCEGLRKRAVKNMARYRQKHPERIKAIRQRHATKMKALMKYRCEVCPEDFISQAHLDKHDAGLRHLERVARA